MRADILARARVYWRYGDKTGVYEEPDTDYGTIWFEDDGSPVFFMWEEGNYACDCNRSVFFGLAPDMDHSFECGDTIQVTKIEVIETAVRK